MIKLLLYRLSHIGMMPLCNGVATRAPWIGDFCFILCYRCLGIVIGVLVTLYYLKDHQPKIKYFILTIPMIIDGILQTFSPYISNNILRITTGLLFGIGIIHGLIGSILWISKKTA